MRDKLSTLTLSLTLKPNDYVLMIFTEQKKSIQSVNIYVGKLGRALSFFIFVITYLTQVFVYPLQGILNNSFKHNKKRILVSSVCPSVLSDK